MTKQPMASDFVVQVPDVGTFTFRKKNMRVQAEVECEFARLTECLANVPDFLATLSSALADLTVLTVSAPDGWDLDALDPEEEEDHAKLLNVWGALRDKQASFRRDRAQGQAGGAGAGG